MSTAIGILAARMTLCTTEVGRSGAGGSDDWVSLREVVSVGRNKKRVIEQINCNQLDTLYTFGLFHYNNNSYHLTSEIRTPH